MSGYDYDSITLANILGNGSSSGPKDISMNSGQAINFVGTGLGATALKTAQTGAASRTVMLPDLAADDMLVMENDPQTLTNKTLTSPIINTPNLTGGTINNATVGATTASTGRFTTASCINTTNQLEIGAGANITTVNFPASAGAVTVTMPRTTDTVVCRATTDTLTNKTLTSPVINTPNLTGGTVNNATIGATTASTARFTAASCINTTNQLAIGAGANITTVNFPASAGAVTLTMPNTIDTLVGRATTDTLTNKTLTSPVINTPNLTGGTINNATIGATTASTGRFTTITATNTTNQAVLGTTNTTTISAPAPVAPITLTLPNTADTLVGRATTDTLTNKTLTAPVISGGTIDNAAIGGTTPANGKFTALQATQTGNQLILGGPSNITVCNFPAPTVPITLTFPAGTLSDTMVARATTDTLTNKTITDSTNNVAARSLVTNSGAGSVSTFAAGNPSTGQILTATSATTATWQNPVFPAYLAVGTSSEDNFVLVSGTPQDITGSTVTVAVAGTYKFSWTSYITSSSVVGDIQVNFIQNTTSISNSLRKVTAAATGAKMAIASECVLGCTAGDVVKLSIVSNSNLTAMVGYRTLIGQRIA